jgi:hypothetical protein
MGLYTKGTKKRIFNRKFGIADNGKKYNKHSSASSSTSEPRLPALERGRQARLKINMAIGSCESYELF